MLIINTSRELHCSKLLLFINSLWKVVKLNQHQLVKTAYVCIHIIVYNCRTQHSTE